MAFLLFLLTAAVAVLMATAAYLNIKLDRERTNLVVNKERNKRLEEEQKELVLELNKIKTEHAEEIEKSRILLSQKKSSETRLGIISENLVPLLGQLPYDPRSLRHLGQPIDYIYFDYENAEVVFVEVKSGNSKESYRQKLIKNIIKNGKVHYEELRINEKGLKVKRVPNN